MFCSFKTPEPSAHASFPFEQGSEEEQCPGCNLFLVGMSPLCLSLTLFPNSWVQLLASVPPFSSSVTSTGLIHRVVNNSQPQPQVASGRQS
jgi:hypothetical protein